ncbi:MAG: IS3 family transposase [Lactobacillus sp.]|nr:IS3 family transposase [Lactobacillus sp.]
MLHSTFYDRLNRNYQPDKYQKLKEFIIKTFHESKETYGYRRIHFCAIKAGVKCSPMTINKLMGELNLQDILKITINKSEYKKFII